jgi:hypothetical protein
MTRGNCNAIYVGVTLNQDALLAQAGKALSELFHEIDVCDEVIEESFGFSRLF